VAQDQNRPVFPAADRIEVGPTDLPPVFWPRVRASRETFLTESSGLQDWPLLGVGAEGNAFFDARPNPPGWVCMCIFQGARFDLPFQTLVTPIAAVAIATLNEWGMIVMALLLTGIVLWRVRFLARPNA
jgi:hypothetical protein